LAVEIASISKPGTHLLIEMHGTYSHFLRESAAVYLAFTFLPRRVIFAGSPVTSMCRVWVGGMDCEFRGKINGI
jgi:hypothetical protein